jgi:hypothetical protein
MNSNAGGTSWRIWTGNSFRPTLIRTLQYEMAIAARWRVIERVHILLCYRASRECPFCVIVSIFGLSKLDRFS